MALNITPSACNVSLGYCVCLRDGRLTRKCRNVHSRSHVGVFRCSAAMCDLFSPLCSSINTQSDGSEVWVQAHYSCFLTTVRWSCVAENRLERKKCWGKEKDGKNETSQVAEPSKIIHLTYILCIANVYQGVKKNIFCEICIYKKVPIDQCLYRTYIIVCNRFCSSLK